jgi:hypothetical protein
MEIALRLVEVQVDGEHPIHVALHQRLTVVTGEAPACKLLAEALGRAFALAGTELSGTLEFSGFVSPLDQTTVISLDLPGEGLTVVTAADLPPPDRRHHDAELEAAMQHQARLYEEYQRLSEMRGQIARRLQATEAAAQVGTEEQDAIQRGLVEVRERITANEQGIREAEAALVDRQHLVVSLGERLAEQGVVLPAVVAALDPVEGAGTRLQLHDDVSAQRELVARARSCGLLDDQAATGIDGWLETVSLGTAPPDPAVGELRDEIESLERRWSEQAMVGVESDPEVVAARSRHDEMAARLSALEELSASGVLVDQARREIDEAHSERVRLEDGRGRSKALDDAIAKEEAATSKYGFGSYLDYTIALSTRSVGEAVQTTLDHAREEATRATELLSHARDRAAAVRHQLTEERAALRERFRELAGVDVEHLSLEDIQRVIAVPPELDGLGERLRGVAHALDLQRGAVTAEIDQLEQWRARLTADGEGLRKELSGLSDTSVALAPLIQAAWAQRAEVAGTDADLEQRISEMAEEWRSAESDLQALGADNPGVYSASDVPVITAHLGPLVDPPVSEPVPVVLADTFRSLGVHATSALESIMVSALRVQIVYITDDPAVLEWARSLQDSAGRLVRLQRPGWFQRRLARRGASSELLNQDR